MGYFYGIKPAEFVWHGEWNDPEVRYNDHLFNYYDVEQTMYDWFKEECSGANDDEFAPWMLAHADDVLSLLDEMIENGLAKSDT